MTSGDILIYGAYGYTGELIARLAKERGVAVTLAGRRREALAPLAEELGFPTLAVGLDDSTALRDALKPFKVVLHCAGPFSRTFRAMAEACIAEETHYLDITGEIEVFEGLRHLGSRAEEAGVMLMPGVGFDVVPSDCLAKHLAESLPDATHLELAFKSGGGMSRGTATTVVENIERGGAVREEGIIKPVPTAWKTRWIDYGRGPRKSITIPWGDVSTAFTTTGIPNICVYTAVPPMAVPMLKLSRYMKPILASGPVKRFMLKRARSGPAGPSAEERAKVRTNLWGEVRNAEGETRVARLETPEGYTLTALTGLEVAERVAGGAAEPGYRTPAGLFGADFILEFETTKRTDAAAP